MKPGLKVCGVDWCQLRENGPLARRVSSTYSLCSNQGDTAATPEQI